MKKRAFNTKYTKDKGPLRVIYYPLCSFVPLVGKKFFLYLCLLVIFVLFLSACGPAAAPTPTVSPTDAPTARPIPTATATPVPTPTSLPTYTPQAAWFQEPDPSYGTMKFQYARVTNPKARVYISLEDAEANTSNFGTLPNYPDVYVACATSQTRGADTFYLTNDGWMKAADLQLVTPSTFSGILITRPVTFRFGWVLAGTQSVNAAGAPVQTYQRYQVVHEVPAVAQKPGYIAIGADEWLPETALALINPAVPAEAGQFCRFIYVDLASQTMSVYDHCKLVFATLISSGENSWTFEGSFTIQNKLPVDLLQAPAESTSRYYLEGVQNIMYYSGNFGFHAAYWHDSFGAPASHGCINLSPTDAKWLYDWAGLGERVIISSGK